VSNYCYVVSEPGLLTVGFYDPNGRFHPHADFDRRDEAADEVARLNGSPKEGRVREIVREEIGQHAPMPPTPESLLIAEFADWLRSNGYGDFDGDAAELLAEMSGRFPADRNLQHEEWLEHFIRRWDEMEEIRENLKITPDVLTELKTAVSLIKSYIPDIDTSKMEAAIAFEERKVSRGGKT